MSIYSFSILNNESVIMRLGETSFEAKKLTHYFLYFIGLKGHVHKKGKY